MAKVKKQVKAKEPVRVRFKELANGNKSIYLDTYRDGRRSYEFLKLYLVPEKGSNAEAIKIQNAEVMKSANAIKAQRIIELANDDAGIKSTSSRSKMLLANWIEEYKVIASHTHRGSQYVVSVGGLGKRLLEYAGTKSIALQMRQVDVDFCKGFLQHLKDSGMKQTGDRGKLNPTTVYHLYHIFKDMLVEAVAANVLSSNPFDRIKHNDLPKRPEVQKDYLTADEVKLLIGNDEIKNPVIKDAFLFACFTGLRISDVRALTWGNIKKDGDGYRLSLLMVKTGDLIENKLSDMAIRWLPERGTASSLDLVFDLPTTSNIDIHLARWSKGCGLGKHVTFHTARHTYATLALTSGADLYTVSKLLGHRTIATTTIYAKIIDKRKDEAADLVSNMFNQ